MRYMYSYMWLTTICMVIAICYIITYIHELETSIYRRCPIAMFDCRRLDNQQTGFFDISWNLRWKWRLAVNNILVAWRTHEWNDSDKAAWKKVITQPCCEIREQVVLRQLRLKKNHWQMIYLLRMVCFESLIFWRVVTQNLFSPIPSIPSINRLDWSSCVKVIQFFTYPSSWLTTA